MPLLGHLDRETKRTCGRLSFIVKSLSPVRNLETWDGTWDRFPVCRKVIILIVKSTQQSVKFTLSLLCGAKLKLTLTDCGNITNQFASKREVVHHQKEANVLKKFYSSQLTHHAVTLLENCVWNRSKARRNCLIWSNYHDFHRDRRLVFSVLNNLISQV